MLQPQSRRQRPTPCWQLQAVPSPSGPADSLASHVRVWLARYAARVLTAMFPRGASMKTAKAQARAADLFGWADHPPSDPHSTRRWPPALDRAAARPDLT